MPTLNIDQFDTEPSVGQKVRVEGEIKSIDTGTGEVDVSYDSVKIIKKKKSSSDNTNNTDNTDNTDNVDNAPMNLDQALAKNFNYTQ